MKKDDFVLYWEVPEEKYVHVEPDDISWKLAEELWRFKKRKSLYLYHSGKLMAFYHADDIRAEAEAGYVFYCRKENVDRAIDIKKKAWEQISSAAEEWKQLHPRLLAEKELRSQILKGLDLFTEAVRSHYLSQPGAFHKFEDLNDTSRQADLDRVAKARFQYSRPAWTLTTHMLMPLFEEFGRRNDLNIDAARSVGYEELMTGTYKVSDLKKRAEKFAVVSEDHVFTTYTDAAVDEFIRMYEIVPETSEVRGLTGNRGKVRGTAFVIKNEYLETRRFPSGMKKGMILIVQNAWPELADYYKKAAAIVANEGGITSHGAIVARELGIPCIVRTTIGTRVFHTGDLVEVNADDAVVSLLKRGN